MHGGDGDLFQKMAEIKRWLLSEATHDNCNSLLVTLICHGDHQGHLYDCNGVQCWLIEDFVRDLNVVKNLRGKPKILVLQCCRGSKCETEDTLQPTSTNSLSLPERQFVLVLQTTGAVATEY